MPRSAIVAAVLLFAALAGSAAVSPAKSGHTTKIAFERYRGPDAQSDERLTIFVVNADGSAAVRLTPDGPFADFREPTWSPDRRKIAYVHNGGRICVMTADGTSKRCLPSTSGHGLSWSPDGKEIVYIPDHTDSAYADKSLVIERINGRKTMLRLGIFPGPDGPDWSPDGQRIAFVGQDFSSGSAIYIIGANGSRLRRLTRPPRNGDDRSVRWSPDGTRLLFVREISGARSGVYVMNPDGGRLSTLVAEPCCGLISATWSPDGRRVAYANGKIHVFDLTTRRQHMLDLKPCGSCYFLDW